MQRVEFRYEQLDVWKASIQFADLVLTISDSLREQKLSFRISEQLAAAGTSVSMNIAEGRGRSSTKSYILSLRYSLGSLYEVVTLCTILNRHKWIDNDTNDRIRQLAERIAMMLNALISSLKRKVGG